MPATLSPSRAGLADNRGTMSGNPGRPRTIPDPEASADPRVQRTRQALLAAFFELVLSRRYDTIAIADIVARAGTGRSTFYEHFANKHAILDASLEGPFGNLADTVRQADNTPQLEWMLRHFWDNRALGKVLFAGAMRRRVTATLVRLVERRLDAERLALPGALLIPSRLAAIQLAEGLLAPIVAWTEAAAAVPADVLAMALRRATIATIDAWRMRQVAADKADDVARM